MSKLRFDIEPYFDDFDATKDFHRVLFRAGTAVQTRELNQLQTILSEQIARFGSHVFREGSIVSGCQINFDANFSYVKLKDFDEANNLIDVIAFENKRLVSNSGLEALVLLSASGSETASPNLNTVYVRYLNSSTRIDGSPKKTFDPREVLQLRDESNTTILSIRVAEEQYEPIGVGYVAYINEGVIFYRGNFVRVAPQKAIVSRYTSNAYGRVLGFVVDESIVTPEADKSLYDNARGMPNFSAPGAHRLRYRARFFSLDKNEPTPNNFTTVVEFNETNPIVERTDPIYDILGKEMARRTYEESGNYIVEPFILTALPIAGNTTHRTLEISRGLGYVHGYRVEFLDSFRRSLRVGNDWFSFPNQVLTVSYGNYVLVHELVGSFNTRTISRVSLRDTAATKATLGNYTPTDPAPGSEIGYADVVLIQHESGVKGTPSARYRLYLINVNITAPGRSFRDVRSIYGTDANGDAVFADLVQYELLENNLHRMLFRLGRTAIRSINAASVSFTFTHHEQRTFATNGSATIAPPTPHAGGNNRIAITGTLSDVAERQIIVIPRASVNAANIASVSFTVNTSSNLVTGNAAFTDRFRIGDTIAVGNSTTFNVRRVTAIVNATALQTNANFSIAGSTFSAARRFLRGEPISFAGANASINILGDGSSGTLTLGETLATTMLTDVYFPVLRTLGAPARKIIRKNRFVRINCSTHPRRNQGPWSLGLPDIHRLRAVYVGTSYSTANPNRLDDFELDDGQRGGFYAHGHLLLKPGRSLGSNSRLLVELDHFEVDYSGGIGYFSIESYPIDDANTSNTNAITTDSIPIFRGESGEYYNLRDVIDFRPILANTAVSSTTVSGATENPSSNATFAVHPSGSYLPIADTAFQCSYDFYLGRIDRVALSPNGTVSIIEGEPALQPRPPREQEGTMTLGLVAVPPYPSLTQSQAQNLRRLEPPIQIELTQNRRYTMRDIGVLDDRLRRVEYYTTLSLLEADTKNIEIPNEQGQNRFKNGFLVDPFRDFSVADTTSEELRIAVDMKGDYAAPRVTRTYCDLRPITNTSTIVRRGELLMLPSQNEVFIEQPFASKVRNCVENIVFVWRGAMTLTPEGDHVPDVTRNPDIIGNVDLSGLTTFFNSIPSLIGLERVLLTQNTSTEIVTNSFWNGRWQIITDTFRNTVLNTFATTQRAIVNFSATTTTNQINFGDIVQDVTVQPYIRPRRVFFSASIRPNTRVWAYFDGVPVSQHCTPTDENFNPTGPKGAPLISDNDGQCFGYFDIPEGQFRTGDRVFRLVDVDDLRIAGETITTEAVATYSASNISITKARLGLQTRVPQVTTTTTWDTIGVRQVGSQVINSELIDRRITFVDPIAQTFYVNAPTGVPGVYISQLDLFFRTKHSRLGVEVQIREVDNGFPTTRIVPFGRKKLKANQVTVSPQATQATSFVFDTPVFLESNREYCFVVLPEGSNDGYTIWVGELGESDVTTGTPIFTNHGTGVLFTSSTNRIWTPFQKEDIKFRLYRLNFTANSGSITFVQANTEFLSITNIRDNDNFIVGERVLCTPNSPFIISSTVSTTQGNTTVTVSNTAFDATTALANNFVLAITNSSARPVQIVRVVSITNSSTFIINTPATVTVSNGGLIRFVANGNLRGILSFLDRAAGRMDLENSTANATVNFTQSTSGTALLIGQESLATANLIAVLNPPYSMVVPQFSYVAPAGTKCTFGYRGVTLNGTFDATDFGATVDTELDFSDNTRILRSRSRQLAEGANNPVAITATMTSTNSWQSPVIDFLKMGITALEHQISNAASLSDELRPRGGSSAAKYVSRRVTLADGQDAEDLIVYLGAYKPSGSEVSVYAKIISAEDFDDFEAKWWTPLVQTTNTTFSARANRFDYRELEYVIPTRPAITAANVATLASWDLYGTFTNAGISNGAILIANSTPLRSGDLVYYVGTAATNLANGFYTVFSANATTIQIGTPGSSSPISVTAASSGSANLHFIPQTAFLNSTGNNIISYYNSFGALLTTYKTFAIKIVLTSEEGSHLSPRLADLRAIALQR